MQRFKKQVGSTSVNGDQLKSRAEREKELDVRSVLEATDAQEQLKGTSKCATQKLCKTFLGKKHKTQDNSGLNKKVYFSLVCKEVQKLAQPLVCTALSGSRTSSAWSH